MYTPPDRPASCALAFGSVSSGICSGSLSKNRLRQSHRFKNRLKVSPTMTSHDTPPEKVQGSHLFTKGKKLRHFCKASRLRHRQKAPDTSRKGKGLQHFCKASRLRTSHRAATAHTKSHRPQCAVRCCHACVKCDRLVLPHFHSRMYLFNSRVCA